MSRFDVVVIGCGIAGLSAARECLRGGLATATLEALVPGGLVLNVNHLEGEIQGSGMDLATEMMSEIAALGAENVSGTVEALRGEAGDLVVVSDAGEQRAGAVVVASGARISRLGIPGEDEFEGRGVSQCADCDGPLFQDQEVVVVGGGDSALQEALALAHFARRVHLVHRRGGFRARRHLADAVAAARPAAGRAVSRSAGAARAVRPRSRAARAALARRGEGSDRPSQTARAMRPGRRARRAWER